MEENFAMQVALQLRKPEGDMGRMIGENMNKSNELINLRTIQMLDIKPGDNILEIGMGNGYFIKDILTDISVQYTGCDYSDTMIAAAIENNEDFVESGQAQFCLATANELPFDDAVFDKIFMVNTIYFYEQPQNELEELKRVLKQGGMLVVAIRPEHSMQTMPFTRYGFTLYSKEKLTRLLEDCGYTVVNVVEEDEPWQEVNGTIIHPATTIAVAMK